jgi:hypothetical protein
MAITDAAGLPVAARVKSASPHKVKLVEDTIDSSLAALKYYFVFFEIGSSK